MKSKKQKTSAAAATPVILLLFLALIVGTVYYHVVAVPSVSDRQDEKRKQSGGVERTPVAASTVASASSAPSATQMPKNDNDKQNDKEASDAQAYCERTNPTQRQGDAKGVAAASASASARRTLCVRDIKENTTQFALVVTVAEEEVLVDVAEREQQYQPVSSSSLHWLLHPFLRDIRIHIYVKSNATKSYRRNNMAWPARKSEDDQEEEEEVMFADLHHHQRKNAKKKPRRIFKSILRNFFREPQHPNIRITELPNVGDEALSILRFLVHNNNNSNSQLPLYTAFVHGHVSSWHGIDVIEQLQCLCLDAQRESYRTLSSPERAFFLQCMPMQPAATSPVSSCGDNENVNNNNNNNNETNTKNSSASQRAARNLRQYRRSMCEHARRTSLKFMRAWQYLFSKTKSLSSEIDQNATKGDAEQARHESFLPVPSAIVRDCCSSFLVHRRAILQHPHAMYAALYHKVLSQPNPVQQKQDPNHQNQNRQEAGKGFDGDWSMYLERFWRTLFTFPYQDNSATTSEKKKEDGDVSSPHLYDFFKDFSAVWCTASHNFTFDCPPVVQVRGLRDVPAEHHSRTCDKKQLHNAFGG